MDTAQATITQQGTMIVPRVLARKWDDFCAIHPSAWFWHTSHWLDYALLYSPGAVDYSCAQVDERGNILAIFPCIVADGEPVGGGGMPTMPLSYEPITKMKLPGRVDLRNSCKLGGYYVRGSVLAKQLPGADTEECMAQVIDLPTWTPAAIRKSYKGLVRQQCERLNYMVLDSQSFEFFEGAQMSACFIQSMRALHDKEAGFQTRCKPTWERMGEWLDDGFGAAILAMDHTSKVIGYTYAILYKQKAYYASSAIDADCGHALQFKMIQYLKESGYLEYEMGTINQHSHGKEQAIEFFKQGFGGELKSFYIYHMKGTDLDSTLT